MDKFNFVKVHVKRLTQPAGFTLIEVLIALAVLAIAVTALLQSQSQQVVNVMRLKEHFIRHEVAMQGITQLQLGLIPLSSQQDRTFSTRLFNQRWYWRVHQLPSPLISAKTVQITVSKTIAGPFQDPLIGIIINQKSTP